MNRRGFFGALVGGIAAATGVRSLVSLPAVRLSGNAYGARVGAWLRPGDVILLKGAAAGKTEAAAQFADSVVALPGTAPWRAPVERQTAMLDAFEAAIPVTDLPEIWPGPSGAISATAALPPLDQVEALMELFGASGDVAPSFAAALIGELVLTRMRLADLQRLHAPAGLAS